MKRQELIAEGDRLLDWLNDGPSAGTWISAAAQHLRETRRFLRQVGQETLPLDPDALAEATSRVKEAGRAVDG